jgi:hypothetical protein
MAPKNSAGKPKNSAGKAKNSAGKPQKAAGKPQKAAEAIENGDDHQPPTEPQMYHRIHNIMAHCEGWSDPMPSVQFENPFLLLITIH